MAYRDYINNGSGLHKILNNLIRHYTTPSSGGEVK